MTETHKPGLVGWLPAVAFAGMWSAQILYRVMASDAPFDPLRAETIAAIVTAAASFLAGCVVARRAAEHPAPAEHDAEDDGEDPLVAPDAAPRAGATGPGIRRLRLVLVTAALVYLWTNVLRPLAASGLDLAALRNDALDVWADGDAWTRIQAILVNWIACWVALLFTEIYRRTRRIDGLLAAAFVVISVAAFSRTLLLIGCVIAFVAVVADSRRPLRLVAGTALVFGAVFAIMAVITRPGEDASGGGSEFLLTYAQAYLFGGVAGLNTFVSTGVPSYATFLTIPRFAQYLLAPVLGLREPPPPYFEFVDTPLPLNVFTSIYPPLHDFGLVGVIFFFLAFGVVSTLAAIKFARTRGAVWNVVAGFLLYATVMTVFDDQFVRGMPVLLIWASGAAVFDVVARRALVVHDAAGDCCEHPERS